MKHIKWNFSLKAWVWPSVLHYGVDCRPNSHFSEYGHVALLNFRTRGMTQYGSKYFACSHIFNPLKWGQKVCLRERAPCREHNAST